jgi:MoaA/NifB/PqqE/SkfB family radical SAM enzyme
MDLGEAFEFLDMLADIKPHTVLFSGGEPLCHPYFFDCLERAAALGLRVSLSTNGTLIDRAAADRIASCGVGYAGVSVDGTGEAHDRFRRRDGAFSSAMRGVQNLREAGCRTGLRFTMARPLLPHLRGVMALAETTGVERVCFYHFIPTGSGAAEKNMLPPADEIRDALSVVFAWADEKNGGAPDEVLTVGNFSDGILLYLGLKHNGDPRADGVIKLLARGGGGRSGHGIVSVRWDGALFADQFSWHRPLGTWRDIPGLAAEPALLAPGGRCASCRWLSLCNGNMRARAFALTGDDLGEDSGCHLTDDEIAAG